MSRSPSVEVPPVKVPPHPEWPPLSDAEREALKGRIRHLLKERDAVLVAHYYTDPELQMLAEETGGCVADSLEMARFGAAQEAQTLVVCGVRFMGETSKILSPEKRVLMPDLAATCSLDDGCPPEAFSHFCDQYPEHTVVVYANTSAAVKARADWMVTSGIALPIIQHLTARGEKVLWAPDRHLGRYVEKLSGAQDMVFWPGSCVVHEEFKTVALERLRRIHPGAAVLVHPESPESVVDMADVVGSTTALIDAVVRLENSEFIVATDGGIFHKMRELAPGKQLIQAPTAGEGATCISCAHCPWMGMNSLHNLVEALEREAPEIHVEASIRSAAKVPIVRMLEFARAQGIGMKNKGNA